MTTVHVGLDLLFLVPGETGGRETYARELLAGMRRVRPDLRLTAFVNRETAGAGPGFWSDCADAVVVVPRASARSRASWALAELAGVARAAARERVDVVHALANFGPVGGPFARVLTLHDLLFRELPQLMPPALRWATEAMVVPAARRADRVVTVSEASRAAIVSRLGLPPDRVVAIPNGFAPRAAGDAARAQAALGIATRRLVLAVATDLPHKNLGSLLEALATMPAADRPVLAIAGHGSDAGALPAQARALALEADVRLLGAVDPAPLADLYARTDAFVTATRYEGFGLPVLEAMAHGLPVACSDLPVLREVAGDDGATWFDPADPAGIATAIARALAGGAEVERRRAAGRARAADFTWTRAAEQTARIYEQAVAVRRGRRRPRTRDSSTVSASRRA